MATDSPVSPTTCRDVSGRLAGVAAGEVVLSPHQREHVDHCLRCQAEVVQHRRILRSMRQLRDEVIEPTPGMLPDLLAEFHDLGERHAVRSLVRRHRVAYAAAIAGIGVALAGGALFTARVRRTGSRGVTDHAQPG